MKNPFKKQPLVKVDESKLTTNKDVKYTYVKGPVRKKDNGKKGKEK